MRVAIASLELDSSSILPAVAAIADFHHNEATGIDLVAHYGGANTALDGFIWVLTEADVKLGRILVASAGVGGLASEAAIVM